MCCSSNSAVVHVQAVAQTEFLRQDRLSDLRNRVRLKGEICDIAISAMSFCDVLDDERFLLVRHSCNFYSRIDEARSELAESIYQFVCSYLDLVTHIYNMRERGSRSVELDQAIEGLRDFVQFDRILEANHTNFLLLEKSLSKPSLSRDSGVRFQDKKIRAYEKVKVAQNIAVGILVCNKITEVFQGRTSSLDRFQKKVWDFVVKQDRRWTDRSVESLNEAFHRIESARLSSDANENNRICKDLLNMADRVYARALQLLARSVRN